MTTTAHDIENFFQGHPAVKNTLVAWRPDVVSRTWRTTRSVPVWAIEDYASTQGERWGMEGHIGIVGEIISDEWKKAFGIDPAAWPGVPFDEQLQWHRRGFQSYEDMLDTFIVLEAQTEGLENPRGPNPTKQDVVSEDAQVAQDALMEKGWVVKVTDDRPYLGKGGRVQLVIFEPFVRPEFEQRQVVAFIFQRSVDGWQLQYRANGATSGKKGDVFDTAVEAAEMFMKAVTEGDVMGWWVDDPVRVPNPRKLKARLLR